MTMFFHCFIVWLSLCNFLITVTFPTQADELYSGFLLPSKWSRHSDAQDRNVLLPLGPKEMIFLVLEDPSSCGLAKLTSIAMMAVIVLSSLIYVIASHPYLR